METGIHPLLIFFVVWGVSAIAAAGLAAAFAGSKNRDYSFWTAWCFVFPPLILWLMLMPKKAGPRPRRRSLDEEDRGEGLL